jgi:hypothetical protein
MAVDSLLPSAGFVECLALGKYRFAECNSLPRVRLSANAFVTESETLSSAALGKGFFVECPIKSTRQSAEHSAKLRIPVVRKRRWCLPVRHRSVAVGRPHRRATTASLQDRRRSHARRNRRRRSLVRWNHHPAKT